jgi:DNA mismatch repair protein MLH1
MMLNTFKRFFTVRACYEDGVLAPVKSGLTPDPKPCAGNDGTIITVSFPIFHISTAFDRLNR